MPTITVDGHSLAIDGERLWIVSGTMFYHRVPAALWGSRLAQMKQAGLNCVEVPVPWSLHEPRPGHFTFEGHLDITAFIRLIAARKMRCVIRLSPCIGEGIDLGGLPPWLLRDAAGKLRTSAPEFLQPVSRFISAVCAKIQGLQASLSRKASGPIIAVQNEHQWLCSNPAEAAAYLGETNRYLRENGIVVPILASNGLFAAAEGEIETWAGASHLHANMRQLRVLKPQQPRIVSTLPTCERDAWGLEPVKSHSAAVMRRVAEALAAGAHVNLWPFVGGSNFGFLGGRFEAGEAAFAGSIAGSDAPLAPHGGRGPAYESARRICTFASQFAHIFAGLDPAYQPAVVTLDAPIKGDRKASGKPDESPLVAVESRGTAGGIVFVFAPAEGPPTRRRTAVVLADGSALPVELERDRVAWILLDTHLHDRATLDYCNLSALALVGRVLVCYGPTGAHGVVSINGSALDVPVPSGSEPAITEHEGITLVVCNEESVAAAWVDDSAVYLGSSGFDEAGRPSAHPTYRKITRLSAVAERSTPDPAPPRRRTKAALGPWAGCGTDEFISGKSERYASIEGPATLDALGAPTGYAWMRLKFKGLSRKAKAGFFDAADRLHLYFDGELQGIVGVGPGAVEPVIALPFSGDRDTLTILVDNLGRRSEGNVMGEPKGLFGPVYEAAAFRAGTPRLENAKPIEPLRHWPVVFGVEEGDATDARRITWRIQHRRQTPLIIRVGGLSDVALLVLNGKPVRVLPRFSFDHVVLPPDLLSRGTNEIQVAVLHDADAALKILKESAEIFEGASVLSERAAWAFAKWEAPPASKHRPIVKAASDLRGRPAWWRALFTVDSTDAPLFFDAAGLSKGQVFVNGHNLARYFVATRTGKSVPGHPRIYIPECWTKVGSNEILLFDEHGFAPDRCRITGE